MVTLLKSSIYKFFKHHFDLDEYETQKLVFLSIAFFFVIASYSIFRSLKTSVFLALVGKEYQPYTRFIAIVLLVPCMIGYSKLVDRLKAHQIVYTIVLLYSFFGALFALFLAHPVYGVANTMTSPWRILGWAFEIFMDLYSALVVSSFWGFVNSACKPLFARKSYGIIVAFGKIGGVLAPSACLLIMWLWSTQVIPLLIIGASLCLLATVPCLRYIMKYIPDNYLEGYYVAKESTQPKRASIGGFTGLKLIMTQPYVLGLFGLLYSVEIISIIFDYRMQILMSLATNNSIGEMSSYMFLFTASFQFLGFIFAVFGTSTLLQFIGIRFCLMIMPISMIILALLSLFYPTLWCTFLIMIVIKGLNYGFNFPVSQILYIPTTKDVQFKSKAWIESFGKTFSKASGSGINIFSTTVSPYLALYLNSFVSLVIGVVYMVISFLVGKKYFETVKSHGVIGETQEKNDLA